MHRQLSLIESLSVYLKKKAEGSIWSQQAPFIKFNFLQRYINANTGQSYLEKLGGGLDKK